MSLPRPGRREMSNMVENREVKVHALTDSEAELAIRFRVWRADSHYSGIVHQNAQRVSGRIYTEPVGHRTRSGVGLDSRMLRPRHQHGFGPADSTDDADRTITPQYRGHVGR